MNFFEYGGVTDTKIQLPAPIVENIEGINVVRDDLLPGGTKRRGFNFYIESNPDVEEWVYASPRQGYAQLALAYSCMDYGKKATVFLPKSNNWHELTIESKTLGANIIEVPMGMLTNIQSKSKKYVLNNESASLIPFGGDHPIIINGLTSIIKKMDIEPPKEIWTVMSSGVLSRSLQNSFPNAKVYAVQIGHNSKPHEIGRAETFRSAYRFDQDCKPNERPPFPSSLTYDSKAWLFVKKYASPGALFWNVGK